MTRELNDGALSKGSATWSGKTTLRSGGRCQPLVSLAEIRMVESLVEAPYADQVILDADLVRRMVKAIERNNP